MKKVLLTLITIAAFAGQMSAQLVRVYHEFHATKSTGEPVYRIYAELEDHTDFVSAVFAATNDQLFIGSDLGGIVNEEYGSITGDKLNLGLASSFEDLAYDSYVTVGAAGKLNGTPRYFDGTSIECSQGVSALSSKPSGSEFSASFGTALGSNLDLIDGGWFASNLAGCRDQGLPHGADNRVLLAQIAIPQGSELIYRLNIQVFDEADGHDADEYVWNPNAVDENQIDGSCLGLAFPSDCSEEIAVEDTATSIETQIGATDASISVYPNPIVGSTFTLRVDDIQSETIELSIFSMAGKLIQSGTIMPENGRVQLPVELAEVTPGFLIANVTVNGKTHAERLVVVNENSNSHIPSVRTETTIRGYFPDR